MTQFTSVCKQHAQAIVLETLKDRVNNLGYYIMCSGLHRSSSINRIMKSGRLWWTSNVVRLGRCKIYSQLWWVNRLKSGYLVDWEGDRMGDGWNWLRRAELQTLVLNLWPLLPESYVTECWDCMVKVTKWSSVPAECRNPIQSSGAVLILLHALTLACLLVP